MTEEETIAYLNTIEDCSELEALFSQAKENSNVRDHIFVKLIDLDCPKSKGKKDQKWSDMITKADIKAKLQDDFDCKGA